MGRFVTVVVYAFALHIPSQYGYAGTSADEYALERCSGAYAVVQSESETASVCNYNAPHHDHGERNGPLLIAAKQLSVNLDVSERLVGRWSGSLPKWMCNLFTILLPFHGCRGEVRFHDNGRVTTRKMFLTDLEGERSEIDGNLSDMTWEIGGEDGNVAEIYMRAKYQGVEMVEHYLFEFRRRGRIDILVIYGEDGNAIAELEKIDM